MLEAMDVKERERVDKDFIEQKHIETLEDTIDELRFLNGKLETFIERIISNKEGERSKEYLDKQIIGLCSFTESIDEQIHKLATCVSNEN